jgi:hypothetical protein
MKKTPATVQPIQYSIPFIPPIAGTNMKVGTGYVSSVIRICLSHRRDALLARDRKEGNGTHKKRDNQEPTMLKDKERTRGRKRKTLPPPPAQEVDVPLIVGSVSCSLLTGIDANDSSVGPSIGMSSYEDATIGDDTAAQDTNDDFI